MRAKKHDEILSATALAFATALSLALSIAPAFAGGRQAAMPRADRFQAQTHNGTTPWRGAIGASPAQRFSPLRGSSGRPSDALPKPKWIPPGIPGGSPGPSTDVVRKHNPIPPGIPGGHPGPVGNGVVGNPGFIADPFGPRGVESGNVGTTPPNPVAAGTTPGEVAVTGTSLGSASPLGGH